MDPEPIDPELIYAKTESGEKAMLQRTLVVQRNLRMVLILVDGNATVAQLCSKTGNAELTQNALVELENEGFIERRADEDSVWTRRILLAQRLKASTMQQPVSEFSTFGDKEEAAPARPAPPIGEAPLSLPVQPNRESTTPPVEPSPASLSLDSSTPAPPPAQPDSRTVFLAKEETEPAQLAPTFITQSLLARLKAMFGRTTAHHEPDLEPIRDLNPIRRGDKRFHLTWPMAVMLGVLSLGVVVVLVALLFPYARYLPAVEAALAERSGQSATVQEMRVTFYPKPGLLLGDVRLKDGANGNETRIAELRLRPVVSSLLSSTVLFHAIELSDISLSAQTIASLSRMLESASRDAAGASMPQVAIANADVTFAGLGLDDLSGVVELSPDGLLQSVSLQSQDRSLQFDAKPIANRVAVTLEGLAWRPSPRSLYRLDSFSLKGEVDGPVFVIDSFEARLFDGVVRGATILRAGAPLAMAGELAFARINAKRFGEALGIGDQFEGETTGKLKFSASSETWADMLLALRADGDFTISRGSLGGIDLPEAVRRVSVTPATLGGATRFEELSGTIKVTPEGFQFSRLLLNAGLMLSTGQINVSRDLQLRGRMDVQMRGRADHSAMPIMISGSLKTPQLQTR